MNFTYENQGATTYLVYGLEESEQIDTASLGMLTNNKVPGIAPVLFTQIDMARYIKYNVSAKVSLRQFFTGIVNRRRLIGVFSGIVDAVIYAEDYMLDAEAIVLDPDFIFVDVSTCEPALIYMMTGSRMHSDFSNGAFFKEIMFTTQFDQRENCEYVARIMNFLNGAASFRLQGFKELLDSIKDEMAGTLGARQDGPYVPPRQPAPAPAPAPQSGAKAAPQRIPTPAPAPAPMPQPPVQPPMPQPQPMPMPMPMQGAQMPIGLSPKEQKKWMKQQQKLGRMPMPAPTPVPAPMPMPTPTPSTPAPQTSSAGALQPGEKPMTLFGLMRSYSKENAAKYKEQKAARKAGQGAAPSGVPTPKAAPQQMNSGFAIPGQPAPSPMVSQPPVMPKPPVNASPTPQPAPAPQPMQRPAPQPAPMPQPAPAPQTAPMPQTAPAPQPVPMPQPANVPSPIQAPSRNFGETVVLNVDPSATTLLSQTMPQMRTKQPYLIRMKTNEKIALNKPLLRIGKERSYVDYFIGDNTAISRSHANFVVRDGDCYVVDTNSTNHTYVNGTVILSNVETKIVNGDKIKLANEEFELKFL